ncbi:MAG: heavy metal-binding domain-containing protein [Synergistaceae bacterium]|nr:heavy metal-binding domain-containing protein [Synergistaceae bacterium]
MSENSAGGITLSTRAFPPAGTQDIGIIYGVSCLSSNFFKDTAATLTNLTVGGELSGYTAMIQKGIEVARKRLIGEAERFGADGVYGVMIATPQVAGGAAEIIMYGTAFKYV